MTHVDFMRNVEGYYGKYNNEFVKTAVMRFITQYDENELDMILESIMLLFLKQYKPEIDVGAIAKAAEKARVGITGDRGDGENVYYNGRLIGHYDTGRFIPAVHRLTASAKQKYIEHYADYSNPDSFVELIIANINDTESIESTIHSNLIESKSVDRN